MILQGPELDFEVPKQVLERQGPISFLFFLVRQEHPEFQARQERKERQEPSALPQRPKTKGWGGGGPPLGVFNQIRRPTGDERAGSSMEFFFLFSLQSACLECFF